MDNNEQEKKEDNIILSEEMKQENDDKKSNEIKIEEDKLKSETQPQEDKPEEKEEQKDIQEKNDDDLENISDIKEEKKEENNTEKQQELQEEKENQPIIPENQEEKKDEINKEEAKDENNIEQRPIENQKENKEEINIEKNTENINTNIPEKKEEEQIENKEESKKEDNPQNPEYDDLDVISDKQPYTNEVQENKEEQEKKIEEERENHKEDVPNSAEMVNSQNNPNNESKDHHLDAPYNSSMANEVNNKENEVPNNQPKTLEINESKKENKENESQIISEKNENPELISENKNLPEEQSQQNQNKEEQKQEEKKEEEEQKEKEEFPKPKSNYEVDYYRENIFNLLNQLSEDIPLDIVPDFLKRAFNMDEQLYSPEFYFKGIFPKIIISRSEKDQNKITGMCSFYYESNEDLNQNLILRINSILVSQDYEEQIIELINFLKNEVESNRIMVYILYDKIEDKFVPNSEAKELFEKKLNFKWYCVVRDEKLNQRYIKYCYNKKIEEYDALADNHEATKAENAIRFNKNNFLINNLLITTINQEQNSNLIKGRFSNSINYNKYINIYALYYLLLQDKNVKMNFEKQPAMKEELQLMCDKMMKYTKFENNLRNSGKTVTKQNQTIKRIDEEIEKSIYKEIKDYLEQNSLGCSPDLYKTDIFLNFETNYSLMMGDIYYNRISSDKINILQEENTKTKFFLLPSKDNNLLFYIAEVNNNLKKILFDKTGNVYEKFMEFQSSTQKRIYEYSLKSVRDVSYIPLTPRDKCKTIYIPCFSFKTHLFAYNYVGINKNVKLTTNEQEMPLNITSIDEFINIEFKPDSNINNAFSTVEPNDLIIENSFIIGIFDNDIINNRKLPLVQFLFVTKDKFLTKTNYKLETNE